jgi:hypothetical protein
MLESGSEEGGRCILGLHDRRGLSLDSLFCAFCAFLRLFSLAIGY